MKEKGDPKLGERLFQRQGCIACHTVAPGEAPKGPSLLGIAARYSRAELTESILKPSAKMAQGFEPQKIATVDGRTFEGFVVRESGDEVELRDVQGTRDRSAQERHRRSRQGHRLDHADRPGRPADDPGLRITTGLSRIAQGEVSARRRIDEAVGRSVIMFIVQAHFGGTKQAIPQSGAHSARIFL